MFSDFSTPLPGIPSLRRCIIRAPFSPLFFPPSHLLSFHVGPQRPGKRAPCAPLSCLFLSVFCTLPAFPIFLFSFKKNHFTPLSPPYDSIINILLPLRPPPTFFSFLLLAFSECPDCRSGDITPFACFVGFLQSDSLELIPPFLFQSPLASLRNSSHCFLTLNAGTSS